MTGSGWSSSEASASSTAAGASTSIAILQNFVRGKRDANSFSSMHHAPKPLTAAAAPQATAASTAPPLQQAGKAGRQEPSDAHLASTPPAMPGRSVAALCSPLKSPSTMVGRREGSADCTQHERWGRQHRG